MTSRLRALDLFSGIGGISLALKDYCQTVAYCEVDPYCQSVLLSRMNDGDLDTAPICTDVRALRGSDLPEVDIITAGFPCQDISVAGNGAGLEGKRSGLFFEILRLAKEIEPAFLFLENVPAICTRGLDRVIGEISALGYDTRWDMLSAFDVGAPHKRERWFMLAYTESRQCESANEKILTGRHASKHGSGTLANADCIRSWSRGAKSYLRERESDFIRNRWWEIAPRVCGSVDDILFRVDRVRGLGNSVCVPQAREAFERLAGFKACGVNA